MGLTRLDYFYDGQVKAYLQQIVAAFYGFCIQTYTRDGEPVLRPVPVRWGDPTRMASNIIKNNSENVINSSPFITVAIRDMNYSPQRRQDSTFVDHVKAAEREYDPEAKAYTKNLGNRYSVERIMPVPYDMGIQVDIWTSNTDQKLQLFEQLAILYNPDVWFQSNVNPMDWGSLTHIMQDGITWTGRSIPVGTENQIDILAWNFIVPIWISPPAKVRRQSVIHQVITNIVNHECFGIGTDNRYADGDLYAQIITTPGNHHIRVDGDEITLLGSVGNELDENNEIWKWETLLSKYGTFVDGVTKLYIKRYADDLDDYTKDIIGTLSVHPSKPNVLLFIVDVTTLPINTLDPVIGIIDPHAQYPGSGLPLPALGQRYLLAQNIWTDDIGGNDANSELGFTVAWGNLVAKTNDIIQYNGVEWTVAFDSSSSVAPEFVVNSFTNKQLLFDGESWIFAVDGEYAPGFWRLGLDGFAPDTGQEPCA